MCELTDVDRPERQSAKGILSAYANPALAAQEKGAWEKAVAYQAMLEMKAKSKYLPHIDEKQIKEEAIMAKYGRFD